MDYSQLASFSSYDTGLIDSEDALSTSKTTAALSSAQFNIGELREQGMGYLEVGQVSELIAGVGLKYGSDLLSSIATSAYNAIGNVTSQVTSAAGNAVSNLATQAGNTISNITSQASGALNSAADNINAPSLLNEVNPEFGETEGNLMSMLNNTSSRSLSSEVISGRSNAPNESEVPTQEQPMESAGDAVEVPATEAPTIIEAPLETAVTAGTDAGITIGSEAAVETAGAALDATGIGAPLGLILGVAGLAAGGYSLVKGFLDIFSSHSDTVAPVAIPNFSVPVFQAA